MSAIQWPMFNVFSYLCKTMKLQKYVIAAAFIVAAIFPAATAAKGVVAQKVYMFGFAASFNDTIVHFTEIQPMDSAWIDSKSQFLLGREQYSHTLRNYLASQDMPHRTCIVIYDKKLSKLQKRYVKMKKLYAGDKKQKNRNDIRMIAASDFQFTPIAKSMVYEEEVTEAEKPKKQKKEKSKKNKKAPEEARGE